MDIHKKRSWGWTDWFVVSIRLISCLLSIGYFFENTLDTKRGLVITLGLLSYAVPQLFYLPGHIRTKPFIAVELLLSMGYTLYITSILPQEVNAASFLYIPMFVVSYLSTKKIFLMILPAFNIILLLSLQLIGGYGFEYIVNQVINIALFSAFGFSFGVFLRQKNQLSTILQVVEEKNMALEHYIFQVERVTLLEERNRMSRELHDTVGHSLTASIVAMEAVQTLIDRDPDAAKRRLKELMVFSRSSLDRLRKTVHDMAMTELKLPLHELLRKTADDFAEQTGTKVNVDFAFNNDYTPEAVKLVLLRCLQETLTNAKKHGNASEITLKLKMDDDQLTLAVNDNGVGMDSIQDGYGIEGMKERIESLRGRFHISSKEGKGTSVSCQIPIGG